MKKMTTFFLLMVFVLVTCSCTSGGKQKTSHGYKLPKVEDVISCKDFNRTVMENGNVWIYIETVTEDEFQTYLKQCQEMGWTETYYHPQCWIANYTDGNWEIIVNRNGDNMEHMTVSVGPRDKEED